jgi:hypothetical protein
MYTTPDPPDPADHHRPAPDRRIPHPCRPPILNAGHTVRCGGVDADGVDGVAGPAFLSNEPAPDVRIFFFAVYE